MSAEARLAISKGKAQGPLARAMSSAGYTFPELAEAVSKLLGREISVHTLKMGTVRPNGDSRPIPRDVAEAIQTLTRSSALPGGFEANRRNWPKLQS